MDGVLLFAPSHLESRLRTTWAELARLARQCGLERAFAGELRAAGSTVEAALRSHRRLDIHHADQQVAALRERLSKAPRDRGTAVPGTRMRSDRARSAAAGRSARKRR